MSVESTVRINIERPDQVPNMTCLCHFSDGSEGVYVVEHAQLLRGSRTTIVGVEGLWVVTEMLAQDEAEVIDAEVWLRTASEERAGI